MSWILLSLMSWAMANTPNCEPRTPEMRLAAACANLDYYSESRYIGVHPGGADQPKYCYGQFVVPSTPAVPLSAASVQDPKNGQKTAGVTVMSDIPENLTHAQGTFKAVYYGATFAQLGYIGGDAAIQIGEESAPCFKGRGGIGDTCLGRERTKLVYKFAKAQNGNTMLVPVSRKDDKVERLSRVDPSRVPVNQVEASRMIGEEMKRKILGLAKALKAAKSTGGAKPSDPGFRKCEKALRDYGIKKNFEFLQDKAYLQSLADLDLEFPLVEAKMIETPAAR